MCAVTARTCLGPTWGHFGVQCICQLRPVRWALGVSDSQAHTGTLSWRRVLTPTPR